MGLKKAILMAIILALIVAIKPLGGTALRFITVSELRADAPKIVAELEHTGEEVVITKKGKPVAILQRVNQDKFMLKPEENETQKE